MLTQLIHSLIDQDFNPKNILYASIDTPIYSQLTLDQFLDFYQKHPAWNLDERYYVFFDEIQYLSDWERHLKDLVDTYPNVKFIASGSAAAALNRASKESGAGRFSDFTLPPLTFAEFLRFLGKEEGLFANQSLDDNGFHTCSDIEAINRLFIQYLNYGGYPETALNKEIQQNTDQFVRNDIVDKVLLKDLPSLYGIQNIQELNRLFSYLAYNTGEEVSLNSISKKSGASKPTITRYIEYLQSAYLVMRVPRIDASASRLQRETNFKIYLNNTSMRSALFAPVTETDTRRIGHLAESAIFAQWLHGPARNSLYYARWPKGEIDMVHLSGPELKPSWAVEIKWSDRVLEAPGQELKGLIDYAKSGKIPIGLFTTKTKTGNLTVDGFTFKYLPTSVYCYTVGLNTSNSAVFEAAP